MNNSENFNKRFDPVFEPVSGSDSAMGAMYYEDTNIFEYVCLRLMNHSDVNISELLADSENITFSGDMSIRRFMKILTTLKNGVGITHFPAKEECGSTFDVFQEEDFLTNEDFSGCECIPVEDNEFFALKDNGNGWEAFNAEFDENGDPILSGENFDRVTLAQLKAALEGFPAFDSMELHEAEDYNEQEDFDSRGFYDEDCEEDREEDPDEYDELICELYGDEEYES